MLTLSKQSCLGHNVHSTENNTETFKKVWGRRAFLMRLPFWLPWLDVFFSPQCLKWIPGCTNEAFCSQHQKLTIQEAVGSQAYFACRELEIMSDPFQQSTLFWWDIINKHIFYSLEKLCWLQNTRLTFRVSVVVRVNWQVEYRVSWQLCWLNWLNTVGLFTFRKWTVRKGVSTSFTAISSLPLTLWKEAAQEDSLLVSLYFEQESLVLNSATRRFRGSPWDLTRSQVHQSKPSLSPLLTPAAYTVIGLKMKGTLESACDIVPFPKLPELWFKMLDIYQYSISLFTIDRVHGKVFRNSPGNIL